jgi:release factor glutamine methyltransferase
VNEIFKYIVSKTYKPLLLRYLSSTRSYSYKNLVLTIPAEVFHPAFFSSTRILLKYIERMPVVNRSFLELGAGSGLISMVASKRGAYVTSSDINTEAIRYLQINSDHNKTSIHIIQSDLFNDIPRQQFDIIAINPPYYKKNPVSQIDHAWYCGEKGEYFARLFHSLQDYIHTGSQVLMVLCEGCDIPMIREFAAENGFQMKCVHMKRNMVEMNFIYKIEMIHA